MVRVADLTKTRATIVVGTVFGSIVEALRKGRTRSRSAASAASRLRRREPRKGRNPRTGDRVDVLSKRVAYFKPGKELKAMIQPGAGAGRTAAVVRVAFRSQSRSPPPRISAPPSPRSCYRAHARGRLCRLCCSPFSGSDLRVHGWRVSDHARAFG